MVDVTPKEPTHRRAVARGKVFMQPETTTAVMNREVKKGDVLAVARVAAIMAAKRTSDLIPLCHPISLTRVEVTLTPVPIDDVTGAVEIVSRVECVGKTGVEMEALTAVSVAALTVYDMAKALDRGMRIDGIELLSKSGGKSGDYRRTA